jgi:hypothetical protein
MRSLDWEYGLVPREDIQILEFTDGQIECPMHGRVDVETCFSCSHMRNIEGNGSGAVECDFPVDVTPMIETAPRDAG